MLVLLNAHLYLLRHVSVYGIASNTPSESSEPGALSLIC